MGWLINQTVCTMLILDINKKLMDPKLIIAIIPAGGARFPKRGAATLPHAAGEASDDGVLLLRAGCGHGDQRGANGGAGGGGPGGRTGRRRRRRPAGQQPGSDGAAGRGGGWSKSSLKMLKERESERRDGMDVVVGRGEKWREGVICHSATTAAAGFSREWRHNLAADMDATFGDGGREMREGYVHRLSSVRR